MFIRCSGVVDSKDIAPIRKQICLLKPDIYICKLGQQLLKINNDFESTCPNATSRDRPTYCTSFNIRTLIQPTRQSQVYVLPLKGPRSEALSTLLTSSKVGTRPSFTQKSVTISNLSWQPQFGNHKPPAYAYIQMSPYQYWLYPCL